MNQNEAALYLGITQASFSRRLDRALQKIKEFLQKDE
jgi:predicted DNA-binding protein (UPF0251 family)